MSDRQKIVKGINYGFLCHCTLMMMIMTLLNKYRNIFIFFFFLSFYRAYNISSENIFLTENRLNSLLVEHPQNENSGTGEEENLKIISAYDKICKILRRCDLPIEIKDIQSISPTLRFAEVSLFLFFFFNKNI